MDPLGFLKAKEASSSRSVATRKGLDVDDEVAKALSRAGMAAKAPSLACSSLGWV